MSRPGTGRKMYMNIVRVLRCFIDELAAIGDNLSITIPPLDGEEKKFVELYGSSVIATDRYAAFDPVRRSV